MRKIKRASELPAWFQLSNFEFLQTLCASGWLSVLDDLLTLHGEWLPTAFRGQQGLIADDLFANFHSNAVDEDNDLFLDQWRYRVEPERFVFRGVSSLSNSVVAYMAVTLSRLAHGKKAVAAIRAFHDYLSSESGVKRSRGPSEPTAEIKAFLNTPFFLSVQEACLSDPSAERLTPHRAVSVNMELPDSMLVDDFKDWLRATRRLELHKAAPKAFDTQDYVKWVDDGYVPLLLLTRWAQISGVEITNAALAEAIFPTRRLLSESNIRRSIRPAAQKWLCLETREALAAQAAIEAPANLPATVNDPA